MSTHGFILIACTLFLSQFNHIVHADSHSKVGLRVGENIAPMNIGTISANEISFMQLLSNPDLSSNFSWYIDSQVGQLKTEAGNGVLMGIGPRLEYQPTQHLTLSTGGRLVYLDRYIYQLKYNQTKNYGGPRQFQTYIELSYTLSDSIIVGYRLQHMSNGRGFLPQEYKYPINPSLDTHNFVLQIPID